MNVKLLSLAMVVSAIVCATPSLGFARAGKCQSLFSSTIGSFVGPVRVAYETGQIVPFDVQYGLVKLSEVGESASLSNDVATSILPVTRVWARRVLIFSSERHMAELAISRAGRGWYINTTTTSLTTGKTRQLAAHTKLGAEATHKLDGYLAPHMRAIRNLFRIEHAVEREDWIRPILSWVEASGEGPLRGNLVELFVVSRGESFYLDRGFEKDRLTFLSETAMQKRAAIAFLVRHRLTFSPGLGKDAPGIFQNAGYDNWVRISMSDDRPPKDPTVLLFQAMANADFIYESGAYRGILER